MPPTVPITMKWSPTRTSACTLQSIQAIESRSRGAPSGPAVYESDANLPAPLPARARHASTWVLESTLAVKTCLRRILGQVEEVCPTLKVTMGGSRDREWNEPTMKPSSFPSSSIPVIATTPVGRRPITLR
jgi:hypothetical protein